MSARQEIVVERHARSPTRSLACDYERAASGLPRSFNPFPATEIAEHSVGGVSGPECARRDAPLRTVMPGGCPVVGLKKNGGPHTNFFELCGALSAMSRGTPPGWVHVVAMGRATCPRGYELLT